MSQSDSNSLKTNEVAPQEVVPDANPVVNEIARHYEAILRLLGEDPTREGLVKTPMRAAKAMYKATRGYELDAGEIMRKAIFTHEGSRMVIVQDVEFYSMCEHHILPFFGKVSVGYLPKGKIVGLSKLARVVDAFARRLQVQERLTAQICQSVADTLQADGVIVACTAEHLCMKMRGVEKQGCATTTLEYCGRFAEDPQLRAEFLAAIK
ncbi:MAG: GTP cyclohydrolase I FolE [Bacteroidales bacterium]|nr:GTP cyclohydrolase I FolE [Bacteroidales bacterium]